MCSGVSYGRLTSTNSSRELSGKDGCLNNQFDSKVNNLNVFCHNQCLEFNKTKIIINRSWNYSSLGRKMPAAMVES